MSLILSILGGLGDFFEWVAGYAQRKAGKQEQQNADAKKTIEQLQAEQAVAAQHFDADAELRDHDF